MRIHAWLTLSEVRLIGANSIRYIRGSFRLFTICVVLVVVVVDDVYIAFKLAFDSHCLKKFCYMNRRRGGYR